MRTFLVAGLAACLPLLMTGCNLLEDQEPLFEPTRSTAKVFASVAQPEDSDPRPGLGDFMFVNGTVTNMRIFPQLGHSGLPVVLSAPSLVGDLYHMRLRPPMFPAELIGISDLPDGSYRCMSGVLQIDDFQLVTGVDPNNPRRITELKRCTLANPAVRFGPVCFRTGGLGPFELQVEDGKEARAWMDLAVAATCPEDGGVGTFVVRPAESYMAVEKWRRDAK